MGTVQLQAVLLLNRKGKNVFENVVCYVNVSVPSTHKWLPWIKKAPQYYSSY